MTTITAGPAGREHQVTVPLPADDELPPALAARLAALPPLNVTRMFAATEDMVDGVFGLVQAIFTAKDVDPRLREIIILREAHLLNVPYEWQANVPMAKNVGVSDEDIRRIASSGPVTGLDDLANLICRATDEITMDIAISDRTLQEMLDTFGAKLTTKYILEISWFNLLSRFLASTRVPLDAGTPTADRTSPL